MKIKTVIIAEAGVNHNGDISKAKELIEIASDAGADYVKFQTFKAENLVTKKAEKASYQKKTTDVDESHFEMIKKLELSKKDHLNLIEYCKLKKIIFLSTPFDIDSIEFLNDIEIPLFKIPSGEINNIPYLTHISKKYKPVVLSTGMSDMEEIRTAVQVLTSGALHKKDITVLHCNTEYPTPMEDVNLRAMLSIKNELKVNVGYSDHTKGIEVPIAAVALGAKIIEKHFTIDNSLPGPDHAASLEPSELKSMIKGIRKIELAMGDGIKKPSKSEQKNIISVRKSIVAKTDIKKGDIFNEKNLTVKRPGVGMSPLKWDSVIGSIAKKNYQKDELL